MLRPPVRISTATSAGLWSARAATSSPYDLRKSLKIPFLADHICYRFYRLYAFHRRRTSQSPPGWESCASHATCVQIQGIVEVEHTTASEIEPLTSRPWTPIPRHISVVPTFFCPYRQILSSLSLTVLTSSSERIYPRKRLARLSPPSRSALRSTPRRGRATQRDREPTPGPLCAGSKKKDIGE
jgi:hypothetical protein